MINLSQIPEEITQYPGLIMLAFRGSVAHGMYVPSEHEHSIDDIDLVGVYIAPIGHYFGFKTAKTVQKQVGKYDYVLYEVRDYLRLLCKSNPNVLGTLWLNPEHYIFDTQPFREIHGYRSIFAARSAYKPFKGYGYAQFQRMSGSREYKGFLGGKRKALVDKFGYDTKMVAHCIRLLRMGAEFLRTGEMNVDRTYIDAEELLDIKQGKSAKPIVEYLIRQELDALDEAYAVSTLPEKPDVIKAERLAIDILVSRFIRSEHENP